MDRQSEPGRGGGARLHTSGLVHPAGPLSGAPKADTADAAAAATPRQLGGSRAGGKGGGRGGGRKKKRVKNSGHSGAEQRVHSWLASSPHTPGTTPAPGGQPGSCAPGEVPPPREGGCSEARPVGGARVAGFYLQRCDSAILLLLPLLFSSLPTPPPPLSPSLPHSLSHQTASFPRTLAAHRETWAPPIIPVCQRKTPPCGDFSGHV